VLGEHEVAGANPVAPIEVASDRIAVGLLAGISTQGSLM